MKTTCLATVALIGALATGTRIDIGGQPDAMPQGYQDQMLAQTSRSNHYTVEYRNAEAKKNCSGYEKVTEPCYLYENAWGHALLNKHCYGWRCHGDVKDRRWCFDQKNACDWDYEIWWLQDENEKAEENKQPISLLDHEGFEVAQP